MKKKQPKFNISETGAFRKYLQITITPWKNTSTIASEYKCIYSKNILLAKQRFRPI
jgi:hypothetical protein